MAYDKQQRFRALHSVSLLPDGGWFKQEIPGKSEAWWIGGERFVDADSLHTRVSYHGGKRWRIYITGRPQFPAFTYFPRIFEGHEGPIYFPPLQSYVPIVEYDLFIDVTPTSVTINGTHDDYPAYEVWVYRDNRPAALKYSYDPRWTGSTALGVPLPQYIQVRNNKWIYVNPFDIPGIREPRAPHR
jgi:hypothetical protein